MTFTLPVEFSYLFMLIFARTGALLMLLPMLGERFVPVRVRLVFAVMIALILIGVERPNFAKLKLDPATSFKVLMIEIFIGLGLGIAIRFLTSAADTASQAISQALGISLGETFNPSYNSRSPIIGTMLTLLLIVVMFELDVHHALIAAIAGSYDAMPPGLGFSAGDFSQFGLRMASQSMLVALQISAPFILFGILFNGGLGILSRLVPQLQVMFVATPISILVGLGMLFILLDMIVDGLARDVMKALANLAGG